jgi:Putative addiction module component
MLKVKNMPVAQRLDAMERLWESFSTEPEKIPSPQWHKTVLADRRQQIEQGTAKFISLAKLRKRLSK